jgi:hypothetical protein
MMIMAMMNMRTARTNLWAKSILGLKSLRRFLVLDAVLAWFGTLTARCILACGLVFVVWARLVSDTAREGEMDSVFI